MAKYRKIDTRIWNDARFNSLTDKAKLTFIYVLTHPHLTAIGAMRATRSGLAAELKWSNKVFNLAIHELVVAGIIKHDKDASLIWLPNFLKYNKPESPNVIKGWQGALDYLPECLLKEELIQHVRKFVKDLPKAFQEALPEAFTKSMPNQEQEQEQEQKINICEADASPVADDGIKNSASTEVQEIFEHWQQVMNHPQAKLDSKRISKIKAALKLDYSVEQLKQAIDGCKASSFHQGQNDCNQRYDDIGLIFRDAEHIERFMQQATVMVNAGSESTYIPSVLEGAI